ncbi:hypothetical protein N9H56_05640 [Pseudomonadales bacterium]|nr:hypothetical protein [Pseudomonadales bacterium]
MQDQGGLGDLFKRCLKGLNQTMGKRANKTHCVGDNGFPGERQANLAKGWIQRRKQLICGMHCRLG